MNYLEEIEQQGLAFLSSFTAIYQLLAGVFLSIMFEKILENSPINSFIEMLDRKYINKVMKFQAFFYNDNRFKEMLINYNTRIRQSSIFPRVKMISGITCFYCCFILVVTGFSSYYQSKGQCTPFVYLIMSSLVVILYDLYVSCSNTRLFSTYFSQARYIIPIIILYFTIFVYCENAIVDWLGIHYIDFSYVWILVLCTPLFSLISILLLIYFNCLIKMYKIRELYRLSHNLNELYETLFAVDPLQDLPKRHRNKFLERVYDEISHKRDTDTINVRGILRNYIKDEAEKECNVIIENIKQNLKEHVNVNEFYIDYAERRINNGL